MKKTSIIVKGIDTYEISVLINNTALVKSKDGTSGLLDIRTNSLIGEMRNCYTLYDPHRKFYTQTWDGESLEETNDKKSAVNIRIYDAKNEKMLVDNCEVVESFRRDYEVFSVRSLKDKKLHLYDIYSIRNSNSVFNIALDDAKKLLDRYNDTYYVLTQAGKKALYFSNCFDKAPKMITGFEYDDIEVDTNVLIFTKNGKKHFRFFEEENNKSIEFDDIKIEEQNKNILYGIKGGTIYVYNTYSKELILQTDADSIEYLAKDGDSSNAFHGEYYFKILRKGKYGLLSTNTYNDANRKRVINQTTILDAEYDDIERGKYSKAFYLEKNGKKGILVGNGSKHQLIEPAYDDITNMSVGLFAFKNNSSIEIKKVSYYTPPTTIISNCKSYEEVNCGYIIEKNNKKGLIVVDSRNGESLINPEYDDIKENAGLYYIVSKDNKKGVISKGKVIIPIEYDEVKLGGAYSNYQSLKDAKKIYFALKRNDRYELAKIDNYEYVDCDIEFVSNHYFNSIDFYREIMVFKDDTYTYVYSYDEKLLRTFPSSTNVIEVEKPINSYEKRYLYNIDGKCYYFKDGKFSEQYNEEKDVYVTRYESDTDLYEIRTLNQQEHDAFCSMIDEKPDEEAEKILQDYSQNKQKVKTKYPTIDLNRISKTEA